MDGGAQPQPVSVQTAPPVMPANWYLVAASRDLRQGALITRRLFGRDWVLYRSRATGAVTAYAAQCAHMGCHLKHATPDRDGIRCALHNRLIGSDGRFAGPDGGDSPLRQPLGEVTEHLGGIFLWIGPKALKQPLPMPELPETKLMAGFVGGFSFEVPWYGLIANGFDMEHLDSVHHRRLREDVTIEETASRFRIAYLTRVTGTRLSDRVMKWLSRDHIRASMTAVGGSLMLVQSDVARPSFVILSMLPRPDGGTNVNTLIGSAGDTRRPWDAARLWVTRWLFRRFFEADLKIFDGLDWHPPDPVLTKTDDYSNRLYRYFCAQGEAHG